jgi:uncharacterized membrane protein
MGIGVSLILIAVGAVIAFAVNATTSGFNVHTVGCSAATPDSKRINGLTRYRTKR